MDFELLKDMFSERLVVALLVGVFVAGFGVAYAVVPITHVVVAGQGKLTYSGDVDIVGFELLSDVQLNVTFGVKVAGSYVVSVDGVEKSVVWSVGLVVETFDVVLGSVPFTIDVKVVEA